ncbi:hypothetical protein QMZ05_30990 [Bradyrhizobium sp. INPA03-11B]|uniref:hypothetical protein n=1 Tax=Bradyrhizobium sp. INPA03-11B TaxID=418598 RepID=UPI00338E0550
MLDKVHHVTIITRVAEDLAEDEDRLRDVGNEMQIEDGVIWVDGIGGDCVQAFTPTSVSKTYRAHPDVQRNPGWLKRWQPD